MNRNYALKCGVSGLAALLWCNAAVAQDESVPVEPVSADNAAASSADIIVTAQKRDQIAQDIPISLLAIGGETLERQGLTSIQDMGNSLAGVNVALVNPGQMRLTIRGAGDISGSNQGSSVNGYYLDETAISYVPGYMPELGLWDIERIEVLRGPQGTLFGEGSEGGTLRVITKKPDSTEFFGRAQVGASTVTGGGQGYSALGSLNIPIQTDVLALSVAASHRKLAGWIDIPDLNAKDTNDAKITDARAALRFTPNQALTVDLFYMYNKSEIVDFGATSPGRLQPSQFAAGAGPVNSISPIDSDLHIAAATINLDLGPATLVSASSWTKHHNLTFRDYSAGLPLFFGDPTATGGQTYEVGSESYSQELRLVSNGDQTFDWTVGAYYKHEDRSVYEANFFSVPAFGNLEDTFSSISNQSGSSWALFADGDYEVTDRLSIQVGGRYFSEKKDFRLTTLTTSVLLGGVAGTVQSGNDDATAFSPKVGVSFEITPDVLLFAKYAEGFRSGGSNTVPLATYPYATADYNPDSIKAYEIGLKTTPMPGWYANLYLFYNDWTDLQLPFLTADNIFGYTANAGSASFTGGEIEIGGRAAPGLNIGLTLSYNDAKIDSDVRDSGGNLVVSKGSAIPQTSKFKAAVFAEYTTALSSGLDATFVGRYRHASGNFTDSANSPALYNENTEQLFASVGISGSWGAINIYGDNLFNRDDTTVKYRPIGALPFIYINYVRPQNFGIEYKAKF